MEWAILELVDRDEKYYEAEGADTGIILLHAYTGSPLDMNFLARKLHRLGYSVLCPVFAGHGTDEITNLFKGNTQLWAEETSRAVAWMQAKGFKDIFIFGLSMGGVFATWALTQSRFSLRGGGVFNSPVICSQEIDISVPFMTIAENVWQWRHDQPFAEVKVEILADHFRQMADLTQFKEDLRPHIAEITKPFFIAQSAQDELINPEDAKLLARTLANADVTYKWYPENTHVITVNRNRQQFEADVIDFLQGLQ